VVTRAQLMFFALRHELGSEGVGRTRKQVASSSNKQEVSGGGVDQKAA
jgi:hypothetical protein